MIRLTVLFSLFFCAYLTLNGQKILIRNVNIIPVEGSKEAIMRERDVLIEGETITSIKKHKETRRLDPADGTEIDGTGKYLIPGLADMHAHYPDAQGQPFELGKYMELNVKNGITALRFMRGTYAQLHTRDSLVAANAQVPTMFVSTPPINSQDWYQGNIEKLVQQYKAEGFDIVKYLCCLRPGQYDTIFQACKRAKIPFGGHVHASGPEFTVDHCDDIEHIGYFPELLAKDSARLANLLAKMAKNDVYYCPNLWWYESNAWDLVPPEKMKRTYGFADLPPAIVAKWDADIDKYFTEEYTKDPVKFDATLEKNRITFNRSLTVLARADQANVKMLISASDGLYIIPGYSMIDEMKLFQRAGINPLRILRAATYNAALFFDQADQWGSITKGKRADLVLLGANPLVNIENVGKVEKVILRGKIMR